MTEKEFAEREAEKAREMAEGVEEATSAYQARVIRMRPGQPEPEPEPSKWVPVAETARQIRTALKAAFPHVKFSVRSQSYSMGSSVTVKWTDGPIEKQVEKIANAHEHIDRDQWGEILSGGNRFVHCNRSIGERIQKYGNARADAITWPSPYEKERHAQHVMRSTEMRPDGQLMEWSR